MQLYARADSGFAAPELYDLFSDNDVKYAIRLKVNKTLLKSGRLSITTATAEVYSRCHKGRLPL